MERRQFNVDACVTEDDCFSEAYYRRHLSRWGTGYRPLAEGNARVDLIDWPDGRMETYLTRAAWAAIPAVPYLFVDGIETMSLQPVEIQSHVLPISLAQGRVGVGGLGLGYYVRRILEKPDVARVVVFERNPHVIALYHQLFGDQDRLEIRLGDVDTVTGETFDFFYSDVGPYMYATDEIPRMAQLCKQNRIRCYHFWLLEAFAWALAETGFNLPPEWAERFQPFYAALAVQPSAQCPPGDWLKPFVDAGVLKVNDNGLLLTV